MWSTHFINLLALLLIFSTVAPVSVVEADDTVSITNSVHTFSTTGGQNGADGEAGADGRPGQPGADGADGVSIINGTSSGTVRIESRINGETVVDIYQTATATTGEAVVEASKHVTHVASGTDAVAAELEAADNAATPLSQLLSAIRITLLHYVSLLF